MNQPSLLEVLMQKDIILSIAKEEDIQLVDEVLYNSIFNYRIAYWRIYDNKPESDLIRDSINYGCEVAIKYIQKCLIFRQGE